MTFNVLDAAGDPQSVDPVDADQIGSLTEAAPASDTASSGLNGRLQRLSQRITSLIALLPASVGQKAKAGSLAVTLASDEDGVKVAAIGNNTALNTSPGSKADIQASVTGALFVQPSGAPATTARGISASVLMALCAVAGGSLSNRLPTAAGYLFNGTTWDPALKPASVSRIASAAGSTNATSAKASAGEVHSVTAYNTTAAVKYLKLYNKASAPTVGTDTPVVTLAIPPNGALTVNYPNGGLYFATGIAFALTGAAADADTTALTAGDVVGVNVAYS